MRVRDPKAVEGLVKEKVRCRSGGSGGDQSRHHAQAGSRDDDRNQIDEGNKRQAKELASQLKGDRGDSHENQSNQYRDCRRSERSSYSRQPIKRSTPAHGTPGSIADCAGSHPIVPSPRVTTTEYKGDRNPIPLYRCGNQESDARATARKTAWPGPAVADLDHEDDSAGDISIGAAVMLRRPCPT